MAHYEDIKIPRSEGWKFSNTVGTSGDDFYARVLINDKGEIDESSYSESYQRRMNPPQVTEKVIHIKETTKKEGCIKKIIKAPFRLLWWIIKQVLIIVSVGMLADWLNDNK